MADFYKPKDVRSLVKCRKILFIGDSNVRPLYKDLLSAINKHRLTSIDILKSPDVDSYFGDIAVQQCGKKNTWSFWENRIYEGNDSRIEIFCTGSIIMDVIRGFLKKLIEVPSSLPDLVYLSYGPSHWKNRRHLLFDILSELKVNFPYTTSFIVGSGFPTTTDSFGDPIFDDIPFFIKCSIVNDDENNLAIIGASSSIGFTYLNLAFYLRKPVFRGVASQPGWESVVVRYTTFLLLTSIAQSLLIKLPGRVNQELLTKAIDSSGYELEEYRQLLLKLSENWLDLKSKVPVDEKTDPAAKNAKEILEKLWKVYRHSRGHGSKNKFDNDHQGSNQKKRCQAISDRRALKITNSLSTLPKSTIIDISGTRRDSQLHHQTTDQVSTVKKEVTTKIEDSEPVEILDSDGEQGECDTESLEEGEIRDPSISTPPQDQDELLSDISLEDNLDDSDDADETGRSILDRRTACQIHALDVPSKRQKPPQPFTIVLSDEEADSEEPVLTYKSNQDVIINLDSGESDAEIGGRQIRTTTQNNNRSQITTKALSQVFSKTSRRRRKVRLFKSDHVNDNLYLKDMKGDTVSWPTDLGILHGETLWKWWRFYIQVKNESSLIVCPKDWPEVNVRIPALFNEKGNIAVPKAIDDLKQFFLTLKNVTFSDDCLVDECLVDYSFDDVEDKVDNTNVPTDRPLPLVEELARGSRVHFQITPKRTLKSVLPKAHVSVCSFASYRQFTARQCNAISVAPKAAEEPNTSVAGLESSHELTKSDFYAYGDKNISFPKAVYPKWTPCSSWVSTSSKAARHSPESHRVKTGDSSRTDRQKYAKKFVDERRWKRARRRRPRSRSPRSRSPRSRSPSSRSPSSRSPRIRSPPLRSYSHRSLKRTRSRTSSPYHKKRRNSRRPRL